MEGALKHRVIVRESLHQELIRHLLRGFQNEPAQEEACLALWRPGDGLNCYTAILDEIFLPRDDDRDLHGNVTVHGAYLNRVLDCALKVNAGVAVIHSHPGPGWQSLSAMDYDTERNIIAPFVRETRLPLLGLTIGSDGVWSARLWKEIRIGQTTLVECVNVRRIGPRRSVADWSPAHDTPYSRRSCLTRTIDSWGIEAQTMLARTHICIVGAGSVGSIVLEFLARTGFEEITVIDPDLIEEKNLDRLVYADKHCLGLQKVMVAAAHARQVATAKKVIIRPVGLSIRTKLAYKLAADADVILCCVDNSEARDVLNHIAYANCVPLIDGGVLVESQGRLLSAKWRVHLVGPGMQCLRCRGQYTSSDARDERLGIRRRGRYINDGEVHEVDTGQNTITFCGPVAAESVRMLIRYLVGEDWWHDSNTTTGQWSFEHRFVEAETEVFEHPSQCVRSCEFSNQRLALGHSGRPRYPFSAEPSIGWLSNLKQMYRSVRMRFGRAIASLRI